MNNFLTVYAKDYTFKKGKFTPPISTPQEFENPLTEGFKEFLDVREESPPEPREFGDAFQGTIKEKKQKIGQMYFGKPLDKELLEEYMKEQKLTTYCHDYVYREGSYTDPFSLIDVKLPDDWYLPETTTGSHFRDPTIIDPNAFERVPAIRGINNLGANEKFNEILQIQTGETEYGGVIGALGGDIVEKQLLGKINHE